MKNKKIALIINTIILIAEVIGFGYSLLKERSIAIEYYTNDSNILALIASLLFIVLYKKDSKLVRDLRFAATSCLTVTFIVVLLILSPMYDFNYKLLMFTDIFFVFHTLCPILSIISYVFFEQKSDKNYLGLLLTVIYAIILIALNILDVIVGPYPFLDVKNQSLIMSMIWGTLIILGSYIIGIVLNKKRLTD